MNGAGSAVALGMVRVWVTSINEQTVRVRV